MHWNVAPDALPGSATFVRILDRWRNDCIWEWKYFQLLRHDKNRAASQNTVKSPLQEHHEYCDRTLGFI